ncbi:MAG: alpha-L-rhamnosidase N-terminal domain-containing protein [Armatimonadota bacterium]
MEWHAAWIWAKSCVENPESYIYVRKDLEVGAAASVVAYVTACSEYRLHVNGRYIGRGPAPCEPGCHLYDRYDLTRIVRRGKNAVGAICRGEPASSGFLMQIEAAQDCAVTVVGTDATWKVTAARDFRKSAEAAALGGRVAGEVYDTRWKPVAWNVVGFDDSSWEDALVVGEAEAEPWGSLAPRLAPLLREWVVFPDALADGVGVGGLKTLLRRKGGAALVTPGLKSTLTLDFGREIVGYPSIRIRDSGCAVIDIEYLADPNAHRSTASGEGAQARVDPGSCGSGRMHTRRFGQFDAPQPGGRIAETAPITTAWDRLIVHGGRREWQSFGRRVFRWVRLSFSDLDSPLHIESVTATRIGYPVEQVSAFECSDEQLNRKWQDAVHALSLCMQDRFEDDPARGHDGSPQIARAQALANYYCFFDTLLPAEALRRFARAQEPAPDWLLMLYEYYLYTADRSLVEELYPCVRRFAGCVPESPAPGGQNRVVDAAPDKQDSIYVALLYHALRAAAKLASAVGEIDDAIAWHDRAEEISRRVGGPPPSEEPSRPEHIVPAYVLPANILGVRPSIPKSAVVVVQPVIGNLEWSKGRVKNHRSFADVEWRFQPGLFIIDINAPEGFILGLPIDRFRNPTVDEVDLTPETPERRARRTYGWRTLIWSDGEEHDPYLDWLRTQEADPPEGYQSRKRCSLERDRLWIRECPVTHVRYEVREAG